MIHEESYAGPVKILYTLPIVLSSQLKYILCKCVTILNDATRFASKAVRPNNESSLSRDYRRGQTAARVCSWRNVGRYEAIDLWIVSQPRFSIFSRIATLYSVFPTLDRSHHCSQYYSFVPSTSVEQKPISISGSRILGELFVPLTCENFISVSKHRFEKSVTR